MNNYSVSRSGSPLFHRGADSDSVKVWASFCHDSAGPMINFENVTGMSAVLDDFLLPFASDISDDDGQVTIFCNSGESGGKCMVCEWSNLNGFSSIVLPRSAQQCFAIDPFELIWPKILDSIKNDKYFSNKQLWEGIADTYDRISRSKGIWFASSLSMKCRIQEVMKNFH